jgi:asparagine synthase (glutamine-hydrolysing)
MCGIAGIWYINGIPVEDGSSVKLMTDSISHRGPDGEGHWFSSDKTLQLGHRRLAIIDLSDGGKQPMVSGEKFVIVFNGEIYNYIELKQQLIDKGYRFKSESDTEVVLTAYQEWGTECVKYFDGMFAFALYDLAQKKLFCARDRFGEKPFYYSFFNGNFYFASEMKALWAAGVPRDPNYSLFYNYFVHDLVENPLDQTNTFFTNIFKLKSAHYFVYNGGPAIDQKKYWELNVNSTRDITLSEASDKFMHLLESSVERRLRSDVPVGTSLSGGLDSSTIVAIIAKTLQNNHTFSARFKDFKKDEGTYINLVRNKFSTKHHDVYVDVEDFISELDKLIFHQEEPFQTGSIFAQYCVYRESRKHNIPVMMDGQGADELLGGYDKDFKFYLRELIQSRKTSDVFIDQIKNNHYLNLTPDIKDGLRHRFPNFYRNLSRFKRRVFVDLPHGITKEFHKQYQGKDLPFNDPNDLKAILKYELTNDGLEKLLKFADRNSMAHSVEVRLPFLNHELVEFVMSLKSELFLYQGWSKAILREGVKDILPAEVVRRKDKIGFEAPQGQWIKNSQLTEMKNDFKSKLINDKIITSDYSHDWKIVIGSKVLYGM